MTSNVLEIKSDVKNTKESVNNLQNEVKSNHEEYKSNQISLNNKIDNLMFLCPNCHSQTENYGMKKIKPVNFCENCKNPINRNRKKCRDCFNDPKYKNKRINKENNRIKTRKVVRPSKEELEQLINTTPMTAIGKMFNVSDNAVRKWAKYYNIELKNRQGFWTKEKYRKNAILE